MIQVTERFLIVAYTFPAVLFFTSLVPLNEFLCKQGMLCLNNFSPFNIMLIDGIISFIICMFFGLFLATFKSFLKKFRPHLFIPKSIFAITDAYIDSKTKIQNNEKKLNQYKKGFRHNAFKKHLFYIRAFLFLSREGYNLAMLSNLILIIHALENLITAFLISFIIYLIASLIFLWAHGLWALLAIALILLSLHWILLHYAKIYFSSLCDAVTEFFNYRLT